MQFSSSLKLDELIIYFQKQLQINLSKHMGVFFKTNAKKVWLQNYHCIVIDVILPGLEVFKDGLGLRIKEKNYGFWLKIDLKNKQALNYKGEICNELKKYDQAMTFFDEAILIDPKFIDAIVNKGNTYF